MRSAVMFDAAFPTDTLRQPRNAYAGTLIIQRGLMVIWHEVDSEKARESLGLNITHAAWCPGEQGYPGAVVLQLMPYQSWAYTPEGEPIPETAHWNTLLVVCGCYSTSASQPWRTADGLHSWPGHTLEEARADVERSIRKGGACEPDRRVIRKMMESWIK